MTDDRTERFEARLDEIVKCAVEAGIEPCDISEALLRAAVRNSATLADAAKLNSQTRAR